MDPVKVVGTITPAQTDEQRERASYEAVWRDLVATKAVVADMTNQLTAVRRAMDDLEVYCRRHVKRLDAIASRIERGKQ